MKKLFALSMIAIALITIGCAKDDNGTTKEPDYPSVIGTWADIDYDYEYNSEIGVSWTFSSTGIATQRVWVKVSGIMFTDNKVNFSYIYDGKTIKTTHSNGQTTTHSVSITGNTMIFGDGEGGYFTLIKQ